jgi:hypothetical protein
VNQLWRYVWRHGHFRSSDRPRFGREKGSSEVHRNPVTHHHPHKPRRWPARNEAADHADHEQVVVHDLMRVDSQRESPTTRLACSTTKYPWEVRGHKQGNIFRKTGPSTSLYKHSSLPLTSLYKHLSLVVDTSHRIHLYVSNRLHLVIPINLLDGIHLR